MLIFSKQEKGNLKQPKPARNKESKVLLCKCSRTKKDFCIRIDRNIREKDWHMAYAFPFHSCMRGEKFTNSVKETLTIADRTNEFHGCPHCGNTAINLCSCGGIFCADGDGTGKMTCPICGQSAVYGHYGNDFSVNSSSY